MLQHPALLCVKYAIYVAKHDCDLEKGGSAEPSEPTWIRHWCTGVSLTDWIGKLAVALAQESLFGKELMGVSLVGGRSQGVSPLPTEGLEVISSIIFSLCPIIEVRLARKTTTRVKLVDHALLSSNIIYPHLQKNFCAILDVCFG